MRQILKQKIYNASDFELKFFKPRQFLDLNFYNTSDFEEQNTFREHDFEEKSFLKKQILKKNFAQKKPRFDSIYPVKCANFAVYLQF